MNEHIKNLIYILIGNIILAFSVSCFILPSNIVVGGTTGLGLLGKHFFGLAIPNTVMIVNVVMFLLGLLILGKKFALTTILSTFIYPFILGMFQDITYLQTLSSDILLSTIFGGCLTGVGIGLVIKAGASTGGMDIPPLIFNKKFGLNVSVMMYLCDSMIILSLITIHKPMEILYGILCTVIMTYMINKILLFGNENMQILIISNKYEDIRNAFINKLDYGLSLINMETGYQRNPQQAILCVVPPRKLTEAKHVIHDIDPLAFVTVSSITEVNGRGFSLSRDYLKN